MKTVVIYSEVGDIPKFFVHDEDISHLNNIYINSDDDENLRDELANIVYNSEGDYIVKMLSEFPIQEVLDGAKVIVAGFNEY